MASHVFIAASVGAVWTFISTISLLSLYKVYSALHPYRCATGISRVILFGPGIIRVRVFPHWVGAALILGFPIPVVLVESSGTILLGIAWIAI